MKDVHVLIIRLKFRFAGEHEKHTFTEFTEMIINTIIFVFFFWFKERQPRHTIRIFSLTFGCKFGGKMR